jgi:hypothetical protein
MPTAGPLAVMPRRRAWRRLRFESVRLTRYDMKPVLVDVVRNRPLANLQLAGALRPPHV